MIDDDGLTPQERAKLLDEIDYENKRQRDRDDAKKELASEIAHKMLADGIEVAVIAKYSGLSAEEIATLT